MGQVLRFGAATAAGDPRPPGPGGQQKGADPAARPFPSAPPPPVSLHGQALAQGPAAQHVEPGVPAPLPMFVSKPKTGLTAGGTLVALRAGERVVRLGAWAEAGATFRPAASSPARAPKQRAARDEKVSGGFIRKKKLKT